ncbi:hypothetical protein MYF75_05055 [Escherichia coli]|nr:hypothetical protein [Escherichia coli]UPZ11626.1 hypothetical protein MYF75_05055 [Escherichia coli]
MNQQNGSTDPRRGYIREVCHDFLALPRSTDLRLSAGGVTGSKVKTGVRLP